MSKGKPITAEEKARIYGFLERGFSCGRIAQLMGRKRNCIATWYTKWLRDSETCVLPRPAPPETPPALVVVKFPQMPPEPSMIPPIPKSRLMGGRA